MCVGGFCNCCVCECGFCNACVCVCECLCVCFVVFVCVFCSVCVCVCVCFVMCGCLVICILYSEVFPTLPEVLPCLFLSFKTNPRVELAKTGYGPHSFTLVVICFVRLLFVLFCVLFVCKCVLPPGDNPIAVDKYIIS